MKPRQIGKDLYSLDEWLDESLGKEGTPEREKNRERAWEEYNAQILLDARKNAHLTQEELARRIGTDKSYISRIERGLIVPTVATLYKIAAAMGMTVELRPLRSTDERRTPSSSYEYSSRTPLPSVLSRRPSGE